MLISLHHHAARGHGAVEVHAYEIYRELVHAVRDGREVRPSASLQLGRHADVYLLAFWSFPVFKLSSIALAV